MTPLHHVGEFLRELLVAVPMPLVRALFVALPLAVLVWVITLPAAATQLKHGPGRWATDLKVWAVLALLIQVVIYAWL